MQRLALGFLLASSVILASACRTSGSNASLKSNELGRPDVGDAAVVIGTIEHRQGFKDYVRRESGGELGLEYATPEVAKAAALIKGVAHLEGARTDGSTFKVQSVRSASFPMAISCRVTGGKDQNGKPAQPTTEFKLGFAQINAAKGPVLNGEQGLIVDETNGAEKGQVIFDFGIRAHGGDQYSAFYFQEADVAALGSGKAAKITGQHENGYDWADGDHIALLDVECKSDGAPAEDQGGGRGETGSLGEYRLVQPTKIVDRNDGSLLVTYRAPCSEHDFEGFFGHTDDSGDMSVHVGVVYPVNRCKPGPMQDIEVVMMADDASGKTPGDGGEYRPERLDGGGFIAAPVRLKVEGSELVATFHVPCSDIDFEAYVKAIDDSGNREMAVGVVFAKRDCRKGGPVTVTRRISNDDPHYSYLGGGEGDPIFYVPMPITIVP